MTRRPIAEGGSTRTVDAVLDSRYTLTEVGEGATGGPLEPRVVPAARVEAVLAEVADSTRAHPSCMRLQCASCAAHDTLARVRAGLLS